MQYSLNLECYRDSFAVPASVVNQHLKLAGALQLKVLLWICAHQGLCNDIENIATDLGASASDVQDALQYWICNDMIVNVQSKPMAEVSNETKPQVDDTATVALQPKLVSQLPKPNRSEVARRSLESPEVSWLMGEAQSKFNRTLSFAESSTLIWLMDTYGISPAIIIMVIQYAVSIDKCNIKFIQTTAINWSNNEIDTVEKAETYLTKLEQSRNDWHLVCRVFGIDKRKPTKSEETFVERWLQQWKFSSKMLKCAYDSSVNNTGKISFPYINKVLNNWYDSDIKKPEQILEHTSGASERLKKASNSEKKTSYDIREIEKLI